jgi:hypothetical protein
MKGNRIIKDKRKNTKDRGGRKRDKNMENENGETLFIIVEF